MHRFQEAGWKVSKTYDLPSLALHNVHSDEVPHLRLCIPLQEEWRPLPKLAYVFGMNSYRLLLAEPVSWPERKKVREPLSGFLNDIEESLRELATEVNSVVYSEMRRTIEALGRILHFMRKPLLPVLGS